MVHRIASVRIRCRKSPPGSGFGPFEGQSQVPVLKFPSYGSKPKLRVTAPAGTRTPLLAITLPPRPPPNWARRGTIDPELLPCPSNAALGEACNALWPCEKRRSPQPQSQQPQPNPFNHLAPRTPKKLDTA